MKKLLPVSALVLILFSCFLISSTLIAGEESKSEKAMKSGSIKLSNVKKSDFPSLSKISFLHIVNIAEQKSERDVLSVKMKNEKGFLIYDVDFVNPQHKVMNMKIDAGNGNILGLGSDSESIFENEKSDEDKNTENDESDEPMINNDKKSQEEKIDTDKSDSQKEENENKSEDQLKPGSIKLDKNTESEFPALAKLTFSEAVTTAEKKSRGEILSVILKNESNYLIYDIDFVTPQKTILSLKIDAGNGNILGVSRENYENDSKIDGEHKEKSKHEEKAWYNFFEGDGND